MEGAETMQRSRDILGIEAERGSARRDSLCLYTDQDIPSSLVWVSDYSKSALTQHVRNKSEQWKESPTGTTRDHSSRRQRRRRGRYLFDLIPCRPAHTYGPQVCESLRTTNVLIMILKAT